MKLFLTPIFCLAAIALCGNPVKVGFYNVENLYDTIPSLFHDDSDYTPSGRYRWGGERYGRKLDNLAKVIDDMDMDLLAIAEVESEDAVRDLVARLGTDYNYIHRNTSDSRGLDVALLYKGDKFIPSKVRQINLGSSRQALYVPGKLMGQRVDLIICHLPSRFNSKAYHKNALRKLYDFADSLHRWDASSRIVVTGDMNCTPGERVMREVFGGSAPMEYSFFFSPFTDVEAKGYGSYAYGSRWLFYDYMLLDRAFAQGPVKYLSCGVFIKDYLLVREEGLRRGYPLRTFSGGKYTGGFSDHLPVYIILDVP